jgi:co-chaperonin GroES (HSP10)
MTKSIILPKSVRERVLKQEDDTSLKSPYIHSEERVLEPSLLKKSVLERLPQPTGWRILVMPYQGKSKLDSGLFIPDEVVERENIATVVANVLKVGPLAYSDKEKYGSAWCKEGQWICIGRYSGSRFKLEDFEVRIINDDEVIATILEPSDVKHV